MGFEKLVAEVNGGDEDWPHDRDGKGDGKGGPGRHGKGGGGPVDSDDGALALFGDWPTPDFSALNSGGLHRTTGGSFSERSFSCMMPTIRQYLGVNIPVRCTGASDRILLTSLEYTPGRFLATVHL